MNILLNNISCLLTQKSIFNKDGRNLTQHDYETISNAAIVLHSEKILWVGESSNIPDEHKGLKSHNLQGYSITPEIVDSHTHLVFGGDRSQEYSMRLNGADYQEIAKAGGGILSTMNSTLAASRDELFDFACERIERIHSYGVGTIEIKSGYALTYEKEKELSLIIKKLKEKYAPHIQIKNTYLAAHAIPKTFSSSTEYLNKVVLPLLEELASDNIIDAVDIFHEQGYFSTEDVIKLFEKADQLNIPKKIHADEFNDNEGATIAAQYNCLSADHLLATGEKGIKSLASSDTTATLLPGTGFFLGKKQADAQRFLEAGCRVAIASDYNPGSCHFDNVLQAAALIAPHYKMNTAQLWAAITYNAAKALGINNQGAIVEGLKPRFSFFKCEHIDQITYSWGRNLAVSKNDLGITF